MSPDWSSVPASMKRTTRLSGSFSSAILSSLCSFRALPAAWAIAHSIIGRSKGVAPS